MTRRTGPSALVLLLCAAVAGGCGASDDPGGGDPGAPAAATSPSRAGGSLDPVLRRHPRIGRGARYRPGPGPGPRGGLAGCRAALGLRTAAHVELFADRTVILLAAGIGTATPRRVDGAYLRSARCFGPLVTLDPTGVVLVRPGTVRTVGDLFAAWGRPLRPRRLLSFRGRVRAYVGARRWAGDVRAVPLGRHAQVTLAVGAPVQPHRRYRFAPGQ